MGYLVQANKQSDVVDSILLTTQNLIVSAQSSEESLPTQLSGVQNNEVYFQIED
jgi:hypothetical protein